MKDIPLFLTDNGGAGLILREIPTKGVAYVQIRVSETPEDLLKQCIDFCRAAGAERIYATGHPVLTCYPHHTTLLHLQGAVEGIGETSLSLFPVTKKTWEDFCNIYNEKMASVPTADQMRLLDRERYEKSSYFVHKDGVLYGIGIVEEDEILAIAACQKGAGREVLAALCQVLSAETVHLTVAQNNIPAMRLYEKCGFLPIEQVADWYEIF